VGVLVPFLLGVLIQETLSVSVAPKVPLRGLVQVEMESESESEVMDWNIPKKLVYRKGGQIGPLFSLAGWYVRSGGNLDLTKEFLRRVGGIDRDDGDYGTIPLNLLARPQAMTPLGTLELDPRAPAGGGVMWVQGTEKLRSLIDKLFEGGEFPLNNPPSEANWHSYETVLFPAVVKVVERLIREQLRAQQQIRNRHHADFQFRGVWEWTAICDTKDPRACPPRLRDGTVEQQHQQQMGAVVSNREGFGVNVQASLNLHHDWTNPCVAEVYNEIKGDPEARIFNFWVALTDVSTAPLGFVTGGFQQVSVVNWELASPASVTFADMKKGDIVVFDTLQKIHGALPIVMEKEENQRVSMEFRVIFSAWQ